MVERPNSAGSLALEAVAPEEPAGEESRLGTPETEEPEEPRTPALALLEAIEERLQVRVIAHYAQSAHLGQWDARHLARLLDVMGKQSEVAFIIQSRGGSADAAHLLSSLLREYVDHVHVYIPTHAYSAATLFALGADTLWMGPTSELSPIDPQVPIDPKILFPMADPKEWPFDPGELIPIPAHVIRDFLEFAGVLEGEPDAGRKSRPRIHPERLETLLRPLNPWVLGWYERADKVSRIYAKEALVNHLLKGRPDAEEMAERIIHTLTDHYASHEASILRGQAQDIGIPVQDCPDDVWKQLGELSEVYAGAFSANIGRILETTDGFHASPVHPRVECSRCGEVIDRNPDFRFCPHCGLPFDERCRNCQGLLVAGWTFCPRCGTAVTGSAR